MSESGGEGGRGNGNDFRLGGGGQAGGDGPPGGPVATLPIWRTTLATFQSVLIDNIRYLPRAAALPILLSLILNFIQLQLAPHQWAMDPEAAGAAEAGGPGLLFFLVGVAGLVPYVLFAVSWHRLMLLGPEEGRPPFIPGWKMRHWHFLGYSLLIGVITAGLWFVFIFGAAILGSLLLTGPSGGDAGAGASGGAQLLFFLAIVAGVLVITSIILRFSFVLPARSLDERYGLGDSWRQTRGQGWRILVVFILVQIVIGIVFLVVSTVLGLGTGMAESLFQMMQGHSVEMGIMMVGALPLYVIFFLFSYLVTALTISILSIAFQTCSGWVPDH